MLSKVLGRSDKQIASLKAPYIVCYSVACLVSATCFYLKGKVSLHGLRSSTLLHNLLFRVQVYMNLVRRRRAEFGVAEQGDEYKLKHAELLWDVKKDIKMVRGPNIQHCSIFVFQRSTRLVVF